MFCSICPLGDPEASVMDLFLRQHENDIREIRRSLEKKNYAEGFIKKLLKKIKFLIDN